MNRTFKLLFLGFIFSSAACKDRNILEFKINIPQLDKEECHIPEIRQGDSISFSRKIKIVQNTLTDTVLLGHTILAPGQVGDVMYSKFNKNAHKILDTSYDNPPLKKLCISPYKGKKATGTIQLETEKY